MTAVLLKWECNWNPYVLVKECESLETSGHLQWSTLGWKGHREAQGPLCEAVTSFSHGGSLCSPSCKGVYENWSVSARVWLERRFRKLSEVRVHNKVQWSAATMTGSHSRNVKRGWTMGRARHGCLGLVTYMDSNSVLLFRALGSIHCYWEHSRGASCPCGRPRSHLWWGSWVLDHGRSVLPNLRVGQL